MDYQMNNILNELATTGSSISYLRELKQKCIYLINNYPSLRQSLNVVETYLINETEDFLRQKNKYNINYVSGLSTGIYLFDPRNANYSFNLIGGKKNRYSLEDIDFNHLFDLASVTKFFSLVLMLKLEQDGIMDFNTRVTDVCSEYIGLEDFTINDLIRMHGEIMTNGYLRHAADEFEEREMLRTAYLVSKRKDQNKYNDIGPMILSDVITKIVSEKNPSLDSFDKVMNYYLFEPLGLKHTKFSSEVHDPKARLLNGISAHAGLFSNSEDISILAEKLFNLEYLDQEHLDKLGEITFPQNSKCNKGNMGIYIKHKEGLNYTFVPSEFSTGSFAPQGWTGSVCAFDPNNKIHYSILTNAIYECDNEEEVRNDKPYNYSAAFRAYQMNVTQDVIAMYILKKYYNDVLGIYESIHNKMLLRSM